MGRGGGEGKKLKSRTEGRTRGWKSAGAGRVARREESEEEEGEKREKAFTFSETSLFSL